MASARFVIDSATRRFGDRVVLKSASIWAYPGRITALLGRNGCGKSTLLKVGIGLVGLDQGTVFFAGGVYLRPRLHELARRGLFYIPDRDLLSRRLTVRKQLEAVAWRFPTSTCDAVLEELGVAHVADRSVSGLSGGERRRAELAAAILRRPDVLLADEPLAEIDPRDRALVAMVLRQLAAEGCAVILTGHEIDDLLELADEVVWMTAGTTHSLGPPAEAIQHAQFRREYVGGRWLRMDAGDHA